MIYTHVMSVQTPTSLYQVSLINEVHYTVHNAILKGLAINILEESYSRLLQQFTVQLIKLQ